MEDVVNSLLHLRLLADIARKFGTCATVLGLDANRVKGEDGRERWEVFVNGGRTPTGIDVIEWSKQAESLGAGEVVLKYGQPIGVATQPIAAGEHVHVHNVKTKRW